MLNCQNSIPFQHLLCLVLRDLHCFLWFSFLALNRNVPLWEKNLKWWKHKDINPYLFAKGTSCLQLIACDDRRKGGSKHFRKIWVESRNMCTSLGPKSENKTNSSLVFEWLIGCSSVGGQRGMRDLYFLSLPVRLSIRLSLHPFLFSPHLSCVPI